MDQGLSSGVYYRREDYLGVARRLLIDIVDFPVAVALSLLVLRATGAVVPDLEGMPGAVLLLGGAPWFAYFVLLKGSRFRTLGYIVAGAQIVDLKGERPGLFQLFGRLVFALAGPLNFVFDIVWLTGDGDRQAFRDKFASTYVVRKSATPAGSGTIALRTYMFWGMTFLFKEVARRPAQTTAPAPPQENKGVEPGDAPPQPVPAASPSHRLASVTLLLCAVCALLFIGITVRGAGQPWDSLAAWGYVSAYRVWGGAYWGLVSSAFVHLALWHVGFNVYWLWLLGSAVERELGPLRYVGFILATAVVSSSVQLAASDATGYGASGVVYGLFGLMWAASKRIPAFSRVLGDRTVPLFLIWLVGCILATAAGVADVANAAHVGGLAMGFLAAHWLVPGMAHRSLAVASTGVLAVLSLVSLSWSPWSPGWVGYKAYQAHLAGDYVGAATGYRRSMALGGDRAWALGNLALAYHASGAESEYAQALAELRAENAEAAAQVEAEVLESADEAEKAPR